MKQTLHTSRRAFKLALLCLMAFVTWGGNYCIAQEVTLDFTQNGWKLSTDNKKPPIKGEYTYNGVTISFDAPKGFYYGSKYLMLKGKDGIGRLTLPAFNFAVEKIEVVGNNVSNVSTKTKENIYVDNTAVSTEKIGSKGTNAFVIDKQYQAAGNRYTLQVSAANAQITYIKIYKRAVDLTATTLTLSAIPTEPIAIGGTFSSTPTLKVGEQTLSDKTITWSSDNDKVATVDAATGTVTGVAAGKANITAKFAGDDTYKTSKASYEIIVKGAPALSFPQTSYTVEIGDVFSTPKLEGLPEDVTPEYTSSNTEVATVDAATGEVKVVGVGTTTITVTSPNTGIYKEATASYELTVNRANSKVVTIDFSTFGYAPGLNVTEVSQNGIKLLLAKGSIYGAPAWYAPAVRMYKKSSLKITATSNIKKIEFVFDGTKNLKGVECTSGKYDEAKGLWIFTNVKSKEATITNGEQNQAHIKKIIVTTELPTSVGTITIATPEGFGTYYNSNSYILPEGLTAFGYTKANTDGTLVKTDVFNGGDVVPANAALVVKGNEGEYECYATDQAATKTLEGNLLKGVTTDTKIEAKSGVKRYILTRADDGILAFYRTNTGNINVKANRAYLEVPTAMAVASFSLEGTATGINNVVTTAAKQGIYTISGVRLNATTTKELPAGIYIVDGKKVIVK